MKTIIEKEREVPVYAEVDVLVCGGGPAGVGAAIRAGKLGLKTMIVETQYCLGGMATAGLMSHWVGRSSSKVLKEIYKRTKEKGKVLGWDENNNCEDFYIHQEAQKIVLEEMMKESNVRILYGTIVCGCIVEDDEVKGVLAENKSGRICILAKCVIDATGDGDIAAYAGVPYYKGRESDGKMQPCTLMFKIGGVDYRSAVFPGSFETLVHTEKGELQELGKSLLPFPAGHVLLYRQPTEGTVCCNMTNAINVDGTNAEDLTNAMLECRSQIEEIIKFLKEYVPGYENCWLMSTGSILGVRETRHFEGCHALSHEDILTAKYYEDWVVREAWFNFDVHNLTGAGLDETGVQESFAQKKEYTIPYGCLLPKKIKGLLLSGRNISGGHLAHSNFRVMPIAIALGEAAGVCAVLYCKHSLQSLKDVNVKEVQEILEDYHY
ncbi:MAG: FAD-dependent oxidoreductase [Bacilli bacterium]